MNQKRRKKYKDTEPADKTIETRKTGITLLDVVLVAALLGFIGNTIYQLLHWRETVESSRQMGLWGSLGLIAVVCIVRKWIDSL